MRTLLLLSFLLTGTLGFAQTPPQPKPATPPATKPPATTPAPAPAQPRRRAPAAPTGRTGIALTVTDSNGATLEGIHVELTGASNGSGDTNGAGQVNFPGLMPGTYRLRFSGDHVIGFEREVTLRAGKIENLTITLSSAPAKKEEPKPVPAPAAPALGPIGSPQIGSVTSLADKERNTKEPRRELLLSCSGNMRNMLLVLTEEQPERIYDSAETTFYVVNGQGSARVGSLQSAVGPGSFIAVPRGTPFSLARQGNRPLVLLWTLSGEPCERAR
jgi:mannose-6-phosphate isomerase-like protein (cupin superfamily)